MTTYDYYPILIKIVPGKPKDSFKKRISKYLFKLYIRLRMLIMPKYLYGANGSKYVKVKHIPHELDSKGNVYFKKGGYFYYNKDGSTYVMTRKGRDTWANKGLWK